MIEITSCSIVYHSVAHSDVICEHFIPIHSGRELPCSLALVHEIFQVALVSEQGNASKRL